MGEREEEIKGNRERTIMKHRDFRTFLLLSSILLHTHQVGLRETDWCFSKF